MPIIETMYDKLRNRITVEPRFDNKILIIDPITELEIDKDCDGVVSLLVPDREGEYFLTPGDARDLAKLLISAASTIEGGEPRGTREQLEEIAHRYEVRAFRIRKQLEAIP